MNAKFKIGQVVEFIDSQEGDGFAKYYLVDYVEEYCGRILYTCRPSSASGRTLYAVEETDSIYEEGLRAI